MSGGRMRALLAYLACYSGQSVTRDRLLGLLWGERFEEQARQSLRQTLSSLRSLLGADALQADRETVRLGDAVSSDIADFRAAISADEEALPEALGLYRDDLLAGFSISEKAFMDWLGVERQRLRDLVLAVLEKMRSQAIRRQDWADLLELASRAVALDPYRETAHRHLLQALCGLGRRNEAMLHYRDLERRLQADLAVTPEQATQQLAAALRTGQGNSGGIADADLAGHDARETSHDARETSPDARETGAALQPSISGRPRILVLPFENVDQAMPPHLGDGITEDIITSLWRFRDLSVLSHGTSQRYRDLVVEPARLRRELGAAYLLEGSLRKIGSGFRITAHLVETASGNQLWAEHFDCDGTEIFGVQDRIVGTIVGTLVGRMQAADVQRARRKAPANLAAYECVLRCKSMPMGTLAWEAERRRLCERAIELDPGYARAHAWLAHALTLAWFYDLGDDRALLEHALTVAKRGVELDENDSDCQEMLGWVYLQLKSFDLATQCKQRALDLNPGNPEEHAFMAVLHSFLGNAEEALGWFDRARQLDPYFEPGWSWHMRGIAHFVAEDYDEAITAFNRSPTMPLWVRAYLAGCEALSGRLDRARSWSADVLREAPGFSVGALTAKEPYRRDSDRDRLRDSMLKAGLPI